MHDSSDHTYCYGDHGSVCEGRHHHLLQDALLPGQSRLIITNDINLRQGCNSPSVDETLFDLAEVSLSLLDGNCSFPGGQRRRGSLWLIV